MVNIIRLDTITIPDCCLMCKHYMREMSDLDGRIDYWCELSIWFPVKKQSCKKQVMK